ncbi:MAG: response regulator [Planctomycetaceae bacterium]|jgi:DNA-binding NarL/FixJ family response regulator
MLNSTRIAQVFIIDQQPVVRMGLRALLEQDGDLHVCGEASDMLGALQQWKSTNPDVVIIDLELNGACSGLDLVQRIRAVNREIPILVYSMLEDTHYVERALSAGARGFCSKRDRPRAVVDAVRQVLLGKLALDEPLSSRLLSRAIGGRHVNDVASDPTAQILSNRELEVFGLIGRGNKTAEIARSLKLSVKTVETHRLRIREKLGLTDSAKLAYAAVRWVHDPHGGSDGASTPQRKVAGY